MSKKPDNPELAALEQQFRELTEVARRLARTPGDSREERTIRAQARDRFNVAQAALKRAQREAAMPKPQSTRRRIVFTDDEEIDE